MRSDPKEYYDDYWRRRDPETTRARSRARAALALRLLREAGAGPERGAGKSAERGGARSAEPSAGASPRTSAGRRRLLEVGCGPGWALEVFAAAGYDARGVDISPEAVEEARRRGLDAAVADIERGALPGGQDVIAALEVLEHLVDPRAAIETLIPALAEGGHLVVSLPNELHLLRRISILAGRSPFGGHDDPHVRHFDDRRARRLFEDAGLEILGRLSDGLAPPRCRLLKRATDPLARWFPHLLGLSHVYLVKARAGRGAAGEEANEDR
ncbi:MAG: class I SAM-dependent methyltransferase [Planctomycetes bacterium]|nr:class I SAM-dependent methyltransferase [Planctomycetota bacterium]